MVTDVGVVFESSGVSRTYCEISSPFRHVRTEEGCWLVLALSFLRELLQS